MFFGMTNSLATFQTIMNNIFRNLIVRVTGHKTPGESSEIRMRLLEGYSTLYTSSNVRVSRIGAKLVCLSITSKQAKVAPEGCHAVQG